MSSFNPIDLIAAPIKGAFDYAGAKEQASASRDAAKMQTDAANRIADVQSKSAADSLAFQKDQAAQDLATANSTQRANYDQWKSREGRLSNLGQMIGMSPFQIPDYVPITRASQITPTGAPAGTPHTGPANMPAPTNASNPNLTNAAAALGQQPPASAPTATSGSGTVTLRNQAGQTVNVPAFQVAAYQAIGYR